MPADTASPSPFRALGLAESLTTAVAALGYEEPTPVQRAVIPVAIAGKDLLAQAATGTGKTAAFALPMLQHLIESSPPVPAKGTRRPRPIRGLVLVPTRELAMQVAEAIHKYARDTGLAVVPLYGGASMDQQLRALSRGCDIAVATPGRALDHLRRGSLDLGSIGMLVLDEADEMLDMGFAEDIDALLSATPPERQTTLFSATMPARILAIARRHLRDPERITIAREKHAAGTLPRVRQLAYVVRRGQKPAALDRILEMEDPATAIVFCRTRIEVDALVDTLNAHGYRAEALHGGMPQRQRDGVMQRVRSSATDLLVATDVAARGLDIERVSHVVNYDLPPEPESYIHRIGRTGRAGREGTAITLVEPREHRLLRNIEQITRQRIEIVTIPTLADLRARRLEITRAAIEERLTSGEFDEGRSVVEQLAATYALADIAAAAIQAAHAALGSEGDADMTLEAVGQDAHHASSAKGRPGTSPRAPRQDDGPRVRLFISAGRRAGIRPGDLVGAITGEAGVPASALGAIQIADTFSLVDVSETQADAVLDAMRVATLRGRKVTVRRDRHA